MKITNSTKYQRKIVFQFIMEATEQNIVDVN